MSWNAFKGLYDNRFCSTFEYGPICSPIYIFDNNWSFIAYFRALHHGTSSLSFSSSWFKGLFQMRARLLIYWTIEPIVAPAMASFQERTRLQKRVDKGWMCNVFNLLKASLQIKTNCPLNHITHWISIRIVRNHLIAFNEHSCLGRRRQ